MSNTTMRARRATVDDLPQLTRLWQIEHLNADALEKRFTEFQVVATDDGEVLATVGLQIYNNHGLMHGEAMGKPEIADELRNLLWQRIYMVARNHSLDRIWTTLPFSFWKNGGFRTATKQEIETIPKDFEERERHGAWSLLLLRGEDGSADALDKQFAMLRAMHAQEAQKMQQRVATVKKMALVLTVVVALLVIAFAAVIFRYGPQFFHRAQQ